MHSAVCPNCNRLVALSDHKMIKVHFAHPPDARPCAGSYQPIKPLQHK